MNTLFHRIKSNLRNSLKVVQFCKKSVELATLVIGVTHFEFYSLGSLTNIHYHIPLRKTVNNIVTMLCRRNATDV